MNEIDENIDFDNFLFLECDYIYFEREFMKNFYNNLNKNICHTIFEDFESEYNNINLFL